MKLCWYSSANQASDLVTLVVEEEAWKNDSLASAMCQESDAGPGFTELVF